MAMGFRWAFVAAGLLWCAAGARAAPVTILSVSASNPSLERGIRLDSSSLVAVHWTSLQAYTNVAVAAKLFCTPCDEKNDATFVDAYLMRQIGPAASLADQVAYGRVRVTGARGQVTLFTGLTLPAGDYYLVIYSPAQIVGGSEPAVAWAGTSDANVLTAAAPGTSRETMLIYTSNLDAPLINVPFPPASFFFRTPTTPAYDLTGSFNLQYLVTSTPSMFIPQVVSGGGWKTSIALVNLDQTAVSFNLKFAGGQGTALPVTMSPGGASPTGTLAPGATYFTETVAGAASGVLQGSAEVVASGRVGVSVALRQNGNGGGYQEVTLPGMPPKSSFTFFFDNEQGTTTLALTNGNGAAALTVSLFAQAENGAVAQGSVTLPPRGHRAFALTQVLPDLAGLRGTLRVFAGTPDLAAMGLRFDPNGAFTGAPAVE